jgi:hypothetical protein
VHHDEPEPRPTRAIERPTADETRAAVRGELREALEQESVEGSPPNVLVEADRTRR